MLNRPDESLEAVVGSLLVTKKQTLAVAESCTGGLLSHRLTNIPGSSAYLIGGFIAYAYEAKVASLGVTWETLNRYGAVSEETALAMARGARDRLGSTLGLSITGIAGPGGGMPGKPVGLTYIALVAETAALVERYVWSGDRVQNKELSAEAALVLLQKHLSAL